MGSPAMGSPHPFTVSARMTQGPTGSASASAKASTMAARSWPPTSPTMAWSASSERSARNRSRATSSWPSGAVTSALRTAPAQLDHPPARGLEPFRELTPPAVGHDAVEALPVHVHDPQEVVEAGHVLLEEGFPDVALVELGIADHGDEACRRLRAPAAARIAGR